MREAKRRRERGDAPRHVGTGRLAVPLLANEPPVPESDLAPSPVVLARADTPADLLPDDLARMRMLLQLTAFRSIRSLRSPLAL